MRQPVTQIKVRYSRAYAWRSKEVPGAIWDYFIDDSDQSVHGFAGGLLTKENGLWTAHYWKYVAGAPAKTREQAILNVLPLAAKVVDESRKEHAEFEKVYDARCEDARNLQAGFIQQPVDASIIQTISVYDTTTVPNAISPEARFTVTFKYENLTRAEVEAMQRVR